MISNCVALQETVWLFGHCLIFYFFFFFFQEKSKQERANVDIVWQLENKNKEIQTLNARVQKVLLFSMVKFLVRASHRYQEVMGSNPVEVLTFSGFNMSNCITCVHNCEDHSSLYMRLIFYKTKVAYIINAIYLFQDHVSIILCFTRNLIILNTRGT